MQYLLVEVGGGFFMVTNLNLNEHIACIVIGIASLPMGLCMRLIPSAWFVKVGDEGEVQEDAPEVVRARSTGSFSNLRRGSFSASASLPQVATNQV